jgi:hypothetical protein
MPTAHVTYAARWRRLLAGAIDSGIGWLVMRAARPRLGVLGGRSSVMLRLLEPPASELLREQFGSPGQRLLGLRTVDRRTGQRVGPLKSLSMFAVAIGGVLATRRFIPVETQEHVRERERMKAEMEAIGRRHPHDSETRQQELIALFGRTDVPSTVPMLAAGVGYGLATRLLRRRIAPTVQISAGRD